MTAPDTSLRLAADYLWQPTRYDFTLRWQHEKFSCPEPERILSFVPKTGIARTGPNPFGQKRCQIDEPRSHGRRPRSRLRSLVITR